MIFVIFLPFSLSVFVSLEQTSLKYVECWRGDDNNIGSLGNGPKGGEINPISDFCQ